MKKVNNNEAYEEQIRKMNQEISSDDVREAIAQQELPDEDELNALHARLGLQNNVSAMDVARGKAQAFGPMQPKKNNKNKKKKKNKVKTTQSSTQSPLTSNTTNVQPEELDAQEIIRQSYKEDASQIQKAGEIETPLNHKRDRSSKPMQEDPKPKKEDFYEGMDKEDTYTAMGDITSENGEVYGVKIPETTTDDGVADESIASDKDDKEMQERSGAARVKSKKGKKKKNHSSKPKVTEPASYNDLTEFENIEIDLDTVEYVSDDNLEETLKSNQEFVAHNQPTYESVLNQSGFIAHMTSLTLSDIANVIGSVQDDYESTRNKYEMIYHKIHNTSIGKITFEEYLDLVSMNDIETLQAGIFFATYPEPTAFDFTCQSCDKEITEFPVPNSNMTIINKTESIEKRQDIIHNSVHNRSTLNKYSTLNKVKQVVLPKTKTIIEIRTPSLRDHLNITFRMQRNPDAVQAVQLMLFTKSISIIDRKYYHETGKVRYLKMTKLNDLYNSLKKLNIDDLKILTDLITEYSMRYTVDYGINGVECPHCHYLNKNIEVDIESLLFQTTLKRLQN